MTQGSLCLQEVIVAQAVTEATAQAKAEQVKTHNGFGCAALAIICSFFERPFCLQYAVVTKAIVEAVTEASAQAWAQQVNTHNGFGCAVLAVIL